MPYPWTEADVGDESGQTPDLARRQAIAAEWNANHEALTRRRARDAFRAEALVRIMAIAPEFDSVDDVARIRRMHLLGYLDAPANWNANGVLIGNLVEYYTDEVLPRINGTGGHPQLTVAQLETIISQVADALPFAGVDGTDTGWPT